jgi:tryptophan 6-halogenase
MDQKIETITIVGGGTAGWMTATYLNKVFRDSIKITLIESANISTIGVGEATFSTIKLFFDFVGLNEQDWMPSCGASYKLAIKFIDWNKEKRHFYHPFQRLDMKDGFNMGEWWSKHRDTLPGFDYSCFTTPVLCDHKRSPRYFDGSVYDAKISDYMLKDQTEAKNRLMNHQIQFPYAYHFNAGLLAKFLRDLAISRGVVHVTDDITDIKLSESGNITRVETSTGKSITGDLFIDCTGFKGLLINKTLNEPFISFSESLLCDTALAMQIPKNIKEDGMNPYTTATALKAGWVWNIPLYGRDGTGYVFSSAFASNESAEREFRNHLGACADNCNISIVKMRIGRNRNAWVKNCVAIGLSNAFVEPLESTGIFFIQHAIEELVNYFPNKEFDPQLTKQYNKSIGECVDGVKDFLILHYFASTRDDQPFWKAVKNDIEISDELTERLMIWKSCLPNPRNINQNFHGFDAYSYAVMLQGLGYLPDQCLPALKHMDSVGPLQQFAAIQQKALDLGNTLPSLYDYLTSLRENQGVSA